MKDLVVEAFRNWQMACWELEDFEYAYCDSSLFGWDRVLEKAAERQRLWEVYCNLRREWHREEALLAVAEEALKLEQRLSVKAERERRDRLDWLADEQRSARKNRNVKAITKRKVDRCSIRLFFAQW